MVTGGGVETSAVLRGEKFQALSLCRSWGFVEAGTQKVAELGILGVLVLVPLSFSFATDEVFAIPKVTVLWVLTLITIAAFASLAVTRYFAGRTISLLDKRVSLPVAIYLLVMSVATIFSVSPTFSLYGNHSRSDGLITMASYIILFFISASIVSNVKQASLAMILSVAAGGIVSALGIYQVLGGAPFGLDPQAFDFRPFSTIGNPDFLGTYVALLFPLSIGLFLVANSRIGRTLYAVSALLIAICLIFTLSRGAWLAFAVSCLILVVVLRREIRRHSIWLALGAIVVAVAIVSLQLGWFTPVRQMISSGHGLAEGTGGAENLRGDTALNRAMGTFEVKDAGIRSRLGYWQGALAVIMDRPLIGGGPNSFAQTFGKFAPVQYARAEGLDRFPDKVHNEFLEAGVAAGIPGILAYIGAIFSLGLLFWRTRRQSNRIGRILHASLFTAWLAYVINTSFIFPTIDTGSMFWVLMGISVGFLGTGPSASVEQGNASYAKGTTGTREVNELRRNIGRVSVLIAHVVLVAILIAGLQLAVLPFLADMYFKAGRSGHDGSDVLPGKDEAQIANIREAIKLNPNDVYYYSQYAWLLGWKALQTEDPTGRRALLDEGAEVLGEAIRRDPRNHQLYYQRGQLYSQYVNDHALDALADFQKATALYPNYYNAYVSMAHFARSVGMFDAAIAADNRMLRIFPHDDTAFQGLSFDLFAAGRYQEAAGILQESLKFDPGNAELYYRLGKTYEAMKDFGKAKEAYTQALALKPDHAQAASALESVRQREEKGQGK